MQYFAARKNPEELCECLLRKAKDLNLQSVSEKSHENYAKHSSQKCLDSLNLNNQ